MSVSRIVTTGLWLLPLVLQAAIAVVMLGRRLVRIFPLFFSYTVLVLSREIVLLFLRYPENLYALVYWCGEALAVLLGLGVIFEAVRHLFPPYAFLRILLRVVWIAGAIAAVTAFLMLVFTNDIRGADRIFEFIILVERSVRFLQASLLIVVIALMSRLGLTWHHYLTGIVAGFGIYSALDLAILELRDLHFVTDAALVLLTSAAYNVAAIIWASYLLRPRRKGSIEHLPETNLGEVNEAVTEYINQWYRRY
jgi:hypothetical protein